MKRRRNGSTDMQKEYARRRLTGVYESKKATALSVGYTHSVAVSPKSKIESTEGYANAVRDLAEETGDIVLMAYQSLKKRNLDNESTETVLKCINTLANAFKVFSDDKKQDYDQPENRLRLAINQHIQHQTITVNKDEPEKTI